MRANSGPNHGHRRHRSTAAPEEPRPSTCPWSRRTRRIAAAGLWQRMMEHAISAAATVPEFIEAPRRRWRRRWPEVVTLLARAPTSLHLGVDADDAVWREAARTGSPLYDVEIRAVVCARWRAVASGSAERRHRVEGRGGRTSRTARVARRDNGTGARRQTRARCSGGAPSWFDGGATSDAGSEGSKLGAVLRLRREPPRRRRPGPLRLIHRRVT